VPKGTEFDDAESRKQAVKSLIQSVTLLGIKQLAPEMRIRILNALYKGFEDYAVDNRGDIGSWVR